MTENDQNLVMTLKLNRSFLNRAYSIFKEQKIDLLHHTNDDLTIKDILFGGTHGTQFKSIGALSSFNSAFDQLLLDFGIKSEYKHRFIYLILFYNEAVEAKSIVKNNKATVVEYTDFLLNLNILSKRYFDSLIKNDEYKLIEDKPTGNYVFVKKHLLKTKLIEDLISQIPEAEDDIIVFDVHHVFNFKFHIAKDFHATIISEKGFVGLSKDTHLYIPKALQRSILDNTLLIVTAFLKQQNAPIYKLFQKKDVTERDLRALYNKDNRTKKATDPGIIAVGKLILYFFRHYHIKLNKAQQASFLHRYFSLFTVFPLSEGLNPPKNYAERADFYQINGTTVDSIRQKFKKISGLVI